MSKIRDGYRVIGKATTGSLHVWYFPTLEHADAFAKQTAEDTGDEYDVCKYIGSWSIVRPAIFVAATDAP